MLKSVAFAGLLAASCAASAATTWTFSYTGFYDENVSTFISDRQMRGSFTGADQNSDGIIEKGEISSFILNGMDYISCNTGSNPYSYCGTDAFRYQIGGSLDFYTSSGGSDPDGIITRGHFIQSGYREVNYRIMASYYEDPSQFVWTDQTQFAISGLMAGAPLPAVPEPGTWAMLGTGLLLLTAAGARARRNGGTRIDA